MSSPVTAEGVRQMRRALGLTKTDFAALLEIQRATVRTVEQGGTPHGRTVRTLIHAAREAGLLDVLAPTMACAACGGPVDRDRLPAAPWCSDACRHRLRKGLPADVPCLGCGGSLGPPLLRNRNRRFCTRACYRRQQRRQARAA